VEQAGFELRVKTEDLMDGERGQNKTSSSSIYEMNGL